MRRRTGHGPNDWTESTPASTGSSRLGGELVTGNHGWVEQGRINKKVHRKIEVHEPRPTGRPRLSADIALNGRGRKYATDDCQAAW